MYFGEMYVCSECRYGYDSRGPMYMGSIYEIVIKPCKFHLSTPPRLGAKCIIRASNIYNVNYWIHEHAMPLVLDDDALHAIPRITFFPVCTHNGIT